MPRIRSVHWDLCRDRELANVSAEAERTFVRLWPHLDDEGRALDDPLLLKADLYPVHAHVSVDDVEHDLCELATEGLILRYEKDGVRYLSAKPEPWAKYQKPRHRYPSDLPAATDEGVRPLPPELVRADVGRASAPVPPSHVGRASAGEEGLGVGEGGGSVTPARPLHHALLRRTCAPPLFDELDQDVAALLDRHGPDCLEVCVQKMVDKGIAYRWPSEVKGELERLLGPKTERVSNSTPTCPLCGGRPSGTGGFAHFLDCPDHPMNVEDEAVGA